jgi:PAS domain S-box-containing protein
MSMPNISGPEEKPPGTPAAGIVVFGLVVAGIIALSYFNFRTFRHSAREENAKDLTAIAEIKAGAVRDWRHERMVDGTILYHNPYVFQSVREAVARRSGAAGEEMKRFLASLQTALDYRRILLRDTKLAPVFSVPDEPPAPGPELDRHIEEALRTGHILLSDIYRDISSGEILMDLVVPVLAPSLGGSSAAGVIIFQIDPRRYLFPFIQSWPSSSRTAETLVVRREGDQVVFLNDLRHRKDTALRLKLPFGESELPAAMAARGQQGLVQGRDYRGVEVLAALRAIPDSPWFLVAKVDTEEIYAAVRRRGWITALFVSVLILTASLGLWIIRRDLRLKFYRSRYQAEIERNFINRRYEAITRHANDMILLSEEDGRIIEANENALRAYGYSLEEILRLNIRDLREPQTRPAVDAALRKILAEGSDRYEAVHVRKDGTLFPAEISISVFDLQGKKYFVAIYRDITERLENERAIRDSEQKFRTLFESSGDAILIHDFEGRILDVNRALCDRLGYDRDEMMAMTSNELEAPEIAGLFDDKIREVRDKKRIFFESAQINRKGARIPVHISWRVIDYEGGPAIISTARNITDQKKTENALKKALAEKEVLLREINHRVKNNMAVVSSLLSLQAARVSDPEAKRALQESRERIRTMGLIHEKLYRSSDFARVDFSEYLRDVAAQVMRSYQGDSERIRLQTSIQPVPVDLDQAIPCGLIVTELVSNAMKHAFPGGRAGTIRIEFWSSDGGGLALVVANDGAPLPGDFDLRTSASLGMQIVAILAEQLGGTLQVLRGNGAGFRISLEPGEPQRIKDHA